MLSKTIGTGTFYEIVRKSLDYELGMSVVRMGDGERLLMLVPDPVKTLEQTFEPAWLSKLGIAEMNPRGLKYALHMAAISCTFFAPSITGILDKRFDVHEFFPERKYYVNNFFVNEWTEAMILALYKRAGHILMIHGNAHTADSMQLRLQSNDIAKVDYLKLTKWQEAKDVLQLAKQNSAPLVLVSAGPGSKWIIPEIERGTSKVVLDIGNAMDHWIPQSLPIDRPKAEAFYKQWRTQYDLV